MKILTMMLCLFLLPFTLDAYYLSPPGFINIRKEYIKHFSASEAFEILKSFIQELALIIPLAEKDIEYSFKLADEISKYNIQTALVVGDGLGYFPIFLCLMGKNVVFVDTNKLHCDMVNEMLSFLSNKLGSHLSANTIVSEFGVLPLDQDLRNQFDLITLIELVGGGDIKGSPKQWLIKAKEMLKPVSYIIIDLLKKKEDSIVKHFSSVFTKNKRLARDKFFKGFSSFGDLLPESMHQEMIVLGVFPGQGIFKVWPNHQKKSVSFYSRAFIRLLTESF